MQVQRSLLPFSNVFTTVSVEDCKTVQDVVDKTIPYSFKDCKLLVTVNNELVNQDKWASTQINEHDLIGLNFVPQGGKGGKTALAVVITIAAVAATIYTGGAAAAAFAAESYLAAAGYAAATVGISIAANMAIGRIMAVPKQTATRDKSEDNVYGLSTSNSVDRWGVVPINLGVNRMYPKQAAMPYTENIDNDQFLRQLFTWGYGNVTVSDLKLGDTPLSSYTNVEIENKLNGDLDSGTDLYSTDVYQEELSVSLLYNNSVIRTAQDDANEIIVDITFQGLTEYNNKGNRKNTSVQFRIETRPYGGSTWTTRLTPTVTGATSKVLRKSYRMVFNTAGRYDVRITRYQCFLLDRNSFCKIHKPCKIFRYIGNGH